MNPETVSPDSLEYTTAEVDKTEAVQITTTEDQPLLPPASSASSSNAQWKEYGARVAEFIQALPGYVTRFFEENKGPLGTIGLIVLLLVTVRLTLALVDAIDDIPLVAPTLELIGLGYTGWFVYRYLLRAANRQELYKEIDTLKAQVLGKGD
jgi:hypothetical protein